MENFKVLLRDDEIPREWYNVLADMPTPMHPPLHPGRENPSPHRTWRPSFP